MDRQTLRSLCRIFNYVDRSGCETAIRAIEKCFTSENLSEDDEMHQAIAKFVEGGGRKDKISFINVVKNNSGWGLKTSKDWVENHYVERWNEKTSVYEFMRK